MAQSCDTTSEPELNQQRLTCLLDDLGDEVVQQLFSIYRTELRVKITLISDYLDRGEYAAVECESHALKSASQNLGLDKMGQVMSELEQAAIAHDDHQAWLSFQRAVTYSEMIDKMDRLG